MKITENTIIVRNPELKPVDIGGQLGMLNVKTGKYIVLNEVGGRIWQLMAEPHTVGAIVVRLTEEFDVAPDVCINQVLPYLEILKKEKLVRITSL